MATTHARADDVIISTQVDPLCHGEGQERTLRVGLLTPFRGTPDVLRGFRNPSVLMGLASTNRDVSDINFNDVSTLFQTNILISVTFRLAQIVIVSTDSVENRGD